VHADRCIVVVLGDQVCLGSWDFYNVAIESSPGGNRFDWLMSRDRFHDVPDGWSEAFADV
jgi:hypothetical protein